MYVHYFTYVILQGYQYCMTLEIVALYIDISILIHSDHAGMDL